MASKTVENFKKKFGIIEIGPSEEDLQQEALYNKNKNPTQQELDIKKLI
jgi:hypothetical protein